MDPGAAATSKSLTSGKPFNVVPHAIACANGSSRSQWLCTKRTNEKPLRRMKCNEVQATLDEINLSAEDTGLKEKL